MDLNKNYIESHWIAPVGKLDMTGYINKYFSFRKDVTLKKDITDAYLSITADSRYILWINGRLVGRGPARCIPKNQSYTTYNIKEYLREGINNIAVLVHRFGVSTGQYINRSRTGLFAYGQIKYNNGKKEEIKTDLSWHVRQADWFLDTDKRISIQLGFQEIFDSRKELQGWQTVAISEDLDGWEKAIFLGPNGIFPWYELESSGIKPLVEIEINGDIALDGTYKSPEHIIMDENIINYWIDNTFTRQKVLSEDKNGWYIANLQENKDMVVTMDFGYSFAGFPKFEIDSASAGAMVDIFYHTALDDQGIPVIPKLFGYSHEGVETALFAGMEETYGSLIY